MFKGLGGRDCIAGKRNQVPVWEMSSPIITHEHEGAIAGKLTQPMGDTISQMLIIPEIRGKHDLQCGHFLPDNIQKLNLEGHVIQLRILSNGRPRKRIHLTGGDIGSAGDCSRNGTQAGTRPDIEYAAACNDMRMVEQITCEGLASRPGNAPERGWETNDAESGFDGLPQRCHVTCQPKRDFGADGRAGDGHQWQQELLCGAGESLPPGDSGECSSVELRTGCRSDHSIRTLSPRSCSGNGFFMQEPMVSVASSVVLLGHRLDGFSARERRVDETESSQMAAREVGDGQSADSLLAGDPFRGRGAG
jgi:hypothetical protein